MTYPFFERIENKLDLKNKSKEWLAEQLGISKGTLYNKFKHLPSNSLDTISMLSKILEFDFLKDYGEWQTDHDLPLLSIVAEDAVEYRKKEKNISVQLKITGTPKSFAQGFHELLDIIKNEGAKHGLEIE